MALSTLTDTFYALRFLRLLTTKWEKTGAFKAGIIDKKGKVLRKPKGSRDKSVYNMFHKLVFNVKRLLNKLPFGKTTIASYLAALYLIKEHTGMSNGLLGEILFEVAGYNPQLDTSLNLNESFLLNEKLCLAEGSYLFCEDLLYFKTGETLSGQGRMLCVTEYNCQPAGDIFGIPVFKLLDEETNQLVIVSSLQLTPSNKTLI